VEDAPQVDLLDPAPPGLVRLQEMALGVDQPGVVDQHVQRPESLEGRFEEAVHIGRRGDVAGHGQRVVAGRLRYGPGGLRIDVGHHQARALFGEAERDRAPDAGPATSDDGDLAGEVGLRHAASVASAR